MAEIRSLGMEVASDRIEDDHGAGLGDCMFLGNGPTGECSVGCERKKLSDLINSMKDRRLSGAQLRRMWQTYDYVFLFTEGEWQPGSGGAIEELRYDPYLSKIKGKRSYSWQPFYKNGTANERYAVSYNQLMGYLTGLELRGGVVWRRTKNVKETAAQYVALYKNFNDVAWKDHHSHDQVYCGDVPAKAHGSGWGRPHDHDTDYVKPGRGRAMITQENPTTLWRMASQLPGIDRRAEKVAAHFGTVRAMAEATEEQWREIDGVGKVIAAAAVRAITEVGG